MFGFPIEGTGRYWGARAIYSPKDNFHIDLLPDRQTATPPVAEDTDSKARKQFVDWINKTALPWLRKEVRRQATRQDESTILELREAGRVLRASPNNSYGYLYIGVREL